MDTPSPVTANLVAPSQGLASGHTALVFSTVEVVKYLVTQMAETKQRIPSCHP